MNVFPCERPSRHTLELGTTIKSPVDLPRRIPPAHRHTLHSRNGGSKSSQDCSSTRACQTHLLLPVAPARHSALWGRKSRSVALSPGTRRTPLFLSVRFAVLLEHRQILIGVFRQSVAAALAADEDRLPVDEHLDGNPHRTKVIA